MVDAVRTPVGSFMGSLSTLGSVQLGAIAVKAAVSAAKIDSENVSELYYGNVVSANAGLNPAKQVAIASGLGNRTISTMVNKACASSMKATMLAAQAIMSSNQAQIVVAAGAESMSNATFFANNIRKGHKYGHCSFQDSLLRDGLTDPDTATDMGTFAETCARKYGFSREDQDEYAIESYKRAISAENEGIFEKEICPVSMVDQRTKSMYLVTKDDEPQKLNVDKLKKLNTVFKGEPPTITAGNASPLSDGASAIVLASAAAVEKYNLNPIAKIIGFADAEQEPLWFTTSPSLAINKALSNTGIDLSQVDLFEINEAFSVVALANMKILNLPHSKVNVLGGAVSLGHPIGCSGARIITTLINALRSKSGKVGVASICNGGGGASAVVLELTQI